MSIIETKKTSRQTQISQIIQQEDKKQTALRAQKSPVAKKENETTKNITKDEQETKSSSLKISAPATTTTTVVSYVIDGDTAMLKNGRIRLIGIDAPEIGQPYFSKAKNKLKELIEGKEVKLEKDITDKDKYGRLLRYVWVDNALINLEMVKLGYANSYAYPPNVKYQNHIVAEREMREK